MFYITQLVYINEGMEEVFDTFEDIAIPLIAKYNGQLLLRIRPADHSVIESRIKKPYEIHLIAFETEDDFECFMHDEERQKHLHLKEKAIRDVELIKGIAI